MIGDANHNDTVTASFNDASVGNGKNITATVTLMGQTAKNYALGRAASPRLETSPRPLRLTSLKETALVIANGHEKTYTVTLPTPAYAGNAQKYGAPTYEIRERSNWMASYYTSRRCKGGKRQADPADSEKMT